MDKFIVIIIVSIFALLNISVYLTFYIKSYKKKEMEYSNNEKIYFSGLSSYFMEKKSIDGYIILTEDELIFASHRLDKENNKIVIPLLDIFKIAPISSIGIIPNGVLIFTDYKVYHYLLFKRKEFLVTIEKMIENKKSKWNSLNYFNTP